MISFTPVSNKDVHPILKVKRDLNDPFSKETIPVLEILEDLMTSYKWICDNSGDPNLVNVYNHCFPYRQGRALLELNGKDVSELR